jgi:hypothetical protein
MNLTMAGMVVLPERRAWKSSQQLFDILREYRFVELAAMGGETMQKSKSFTTGRNYFFRKHGQCTVNFLKDGRVHVLSGPIALWNLHDSLSSEELTILIAFATMCEEHQECMRNYMAPQCQRYLDVLHKMPRFQVDWKLAFLEAYSRVFID